MLDMIPVMLKNMKNLKGSIDPLLWVIITVLIIGFFIAIYVGVNTWFTNVNIQPTP
ncbi:MAG: hypothetical protein GTN76_02905 [Candidatus Aenigmarchaeota archaeon]|nr:hypothetical protein [Candidatus Aenigmarchaeota archaeon]